MKHLRKFNEDKVETGVRSGLESFYKAYKDLLYYQNNLDEFDEEDNEYQDDEMESEIWELIDQYKVTKDEVDWILKNKDTSFDDFAYGRSGGFLKWISNSSEWMSEEDKIKEEWEKSFGGKTPSNQDKAEWYHQMRKKGFDGIKIFNTIKVF